MKVDRVPRLHKEIFDLNKISITTEIFRGKKQHTVRAKDGRYLDSYNANVFEVETVGNLAIIKPRDWQGGLTLC